jgi:Kef-type K+ transport system membrane component KefB
MSSFLQFAFLLAVILLAAKLAGYLSIRLGQPSVLGELLIGVVLGPSLVNLLHLPIVQDEVLGEMIKMMGEIGVLFLMFIAGLELEFNELRQTRHVSALAGAMGVAVPVLLGWVVGVIFKMEPNSAIFLGLTMGATSVSISAQTLMEMKVLRSKVGLGLLGAAVFDDILVILLLSIFFALTDGAGTLLGVVLVFLRMLLFFGLAAAFGLWILPRLLKWVRHLPISQSVLSLAIVTILGYGLAAELIGGMAAITGAFLAGLMFARNPEKGNLEPRISSLAYGFFVPIFFVDIGLGINLSSLAKGLVFAIVVIVVAIIGKFIGAGLGARWAGFSWRESAQVGAGMVSRGEVGLIVANLGVSAGLVTSAEFSAIVGMVIASTLITPPVLRWLFKETQQPKIEPKPDEAAV